MILNTVGTDITSWVRWPMTLDATGATVEWNDVLRETASQVAGYRLGGHICKEKA